MPRQQASSPDDLNLRDRQLAAAIRHTHALEGHRVKALSDGISLFAICDCGVQVGMDGLREHWYNICRDTPIRVT
jgi:hypothetical protein